MDALLIVSLLANAFLGLSLIKSENAYRALYDESVNELNNLKNKMYNLKIQLHNRDKEV